MTRIKRLSQRECERAMPVEEIVPMPDAEVRIGDQVITMVVDHRGARVAIRDGKRVLVKRKTRFLNDGLGLLLVCSPSPADPDGVRRSWLYRWNPGTSVTSKSGKAYRRQKRIGLGSLNAVPLERARELAERCRRSIEDGQDPQLVKKSRKAALLVEEKRLRPLRAAINEYLMHHAKGRSASYTNTWKRGFERHLHKLLDIPVSKIDRTMVIEALREVWDKHPDIGSRLRSRLASIFSACMAWGWVPTGENPADWKALKFSFRPRSELQPVERHAALPYAEVPQFMKQLREVEGIRARGLELLTLTAVRAKELYGAMGEEFNLDAATWTIPWTRTKTGKKTQEDHNVPLSSQACECLKRLEIIPGQRVFPGVHEKALYRVLKSIRPDATVHGFRTSFSTWANQSGHPPHIIEAVLDHVTAKGNAAAKAYHRGPAWIEQQRRALQDWADFLDGKAVVENVVRMRRRGK